MTRASTLYAYYDKVSSRSNLKLLLMHQAREIVFENDTDSDLIASGVKALNRESNQTVSFTARKEVILAAGAVYTPQLLQWSGIGPKSILESSGIATKLDLAAVGSNFQDHATAYYSWSRECKTFRLQRWRIENTNSGIVGNATFPRATELTSNATFWDEAVDLYHNNLTGPLTKAQANYIAFPALATIADDAETMINDLLNQTEGAYLPDIYTSSPELIAGYEAQKQLLAAQLGNGSVSAIELPIGGNGGLLNSLQKPLSRGTVRLNVSDVYGEPVVFYNMLANPFDRAILFRSLEYTRKLQNTSAVAPLEPLEVWPGANATTEETALQAMIDVGWLQPTFAHPSCSCPMLPQELGGVVSPDLQVYGTQKLSIIDASIMPVLPGAHLQATMFMIAEKASDIIKSRH